MTFFLTIKRLMWLYLSIAGLLIVLAFAWFFYWPRVLWRDLIDWLFLEDDEEPYE